MSDRSPKSIVFKIGLILLALACLCWLSILAIPFLPISTGAKVGATAFMLIAGEVVFWIGAICTGKEFIQRYKNRLRSKSWKNNSSSKK